jgi:hypothetical protein
VLARRAGRGNLCFSPRNPPIIRRKYALLLIIRRILSNHSQRDMLLRNHTISVRRVAN